MTGTEQNSNIELSAAPFDSVDPPTQEGKVTKLQGPARLFFEPIIQTHRPANERIPIKRNNNATT